MTEKAIHLSENDADTSQSALPEGGEFLRER